MKLIKALIKLSRPLNCLMVSFGVIIGAFIGVGMDFSFALPVFLAVLVGAVISAGGNSLNDYFDREIDAVVHPQRPLPSKTLTPKSVLMFAIGCFVIGIFFSVFINIICLIITLFSITILILYEKYLKSKGLAGNIAIAFLTGSVFLFGGVAVEKIIAPAMLAVLAFFAGLAREIIKDVEDITGDKRQRCTLPMKIGKENSVIIADFCLAGAVFLSFLPLLKNVLGKAYLMITAVDIMFIYSMFIAFKNPGFAQRTIKLGMILALVSFLLASITSLFNRSLF